MLTRLLSITFIDLSLIEYYIVRFCHELQSSNHPSWILSQYQERAKIVIVRLATQGATCFHFEEPTRTR